MSKDKKKSTEPEKIEDYLSGLTKNYHDVVVEISFINNNIGPIYSHILAVMDSLDNTDKGTDFIDIFKEVLYSLLMIDGAFKNIEKFCKVNMGVQLSGEYIKKITQILGM